MPTRRWGFSEQTTWPSYPLTWPTCLTYPPDLPTYLRLPAYLPDLPAYLSYFTYLSYPPNQTFYLPPPFLRRNRLVESTKFFQFKNVGGSPSTLLYPVSLLIGCWDWVQGGDPLYAAVKCLSGCWGQIWRNFSISLQKKDMAHPFPDWNFFQGPKQSPPPK